LAWRRPSHRGEVQATLGHKSATATLDPTATSGPTETSRPGTSSTNAGKVCVCELVPLFDLSQPTVSHHLKVLRQAGIVGSEREGLWAYYYVIRDALKEFSAWLS